MAHRGGRGGMVVSGTMLREYPPHSPDLYMFGYWAITDRYGNEIIREVK